MEIHLVLPVNLLDPEELKQTNKKKFGAILRGLW